MSGQRLAMQTPYGWGWISIAQRQDALRVWWILRSKGYAEAPWAQLLSYAIEKEYLGREWNKALRRANAIPLSLNEFNKECLSFPGASNPVLIPLDMIRFKHVKTQLKLCPNKLIYTPSQRRRFRDNPSLLEKLFTTIQRLPLADKVKSFAKLALHNAAPGILPFNDMDKCKICPNSPRVSMEHLFSTCQLVQRFKSAAKLLFANHKHHQDLENHVDWRAPPKSQVISTLFFIYTYAAWIARCKLRYQDHQVPTVQQCIPLVLEEFRQHVVVIVRRLNHRKEERRKLLDDWLIPNHLSYRKGLFIKSCHPL